MISEEQKLISNACIGGSSITANPFANNGKYIRTEEHKKLYSEIAKKHGFKPPSRKGTTWSKEQREKFMIKAKGKNTWSKGRKLSTEHIIAISKSLQGKKHSIEHVEKIASIHRGSKRTIESRIRISIAHRKHANGNWLNGISDEKYPKEFYQERMINDYQRTN